MKHLASLFCLLLLVGFAKNLCAQCPTFVACPAQTDTFCDLTPNDPLFWNQPGFVTPLTGISDLFEAPVDLAVQVKTTCGNVADIGLRCLLYLDLDADGTQETVVDSDNLPPAGTVLKGNAANPNFTGGTSANFDTRPVSDIHKMRFSLQKTTAGDTLTARLRWNTGFAPADFLETYLPAGQHRVVWLLQQPGGGTDTCSRTFRVVDCKAPTVSCIPGLSVNFPLTSKIQLWASDFLKYTEDNTTPTGKLEIAVRRKGSGSGFPLDTFGKPVLSITFVCPTDLGLQNVELWSRDKTGNADFCETYVIVQDNGAFCTEPPPPITACAKHHCNNATFEDFEVTVASGGPGIPPFTKVFQSGSDGCATIKGGTPLGSGINLTPGNDNNPLNGVSTYDLVLISKHILGLDPLPSPYHLIAADANRSGSVTTFDIVELRKLILGIYTELPNNESWRFVDKSFVFPDAANPFKTAFPESISLNLPTIFIKNIDFTAMKIGDVNCSAAANSFSGETDDRTALPLLASDRWLAAGETLDLPLWTDAAGGWLGCQLAFGYDPQVLDIENVGSEWLVGFDAQHWAKPQPGRVNVSWSGGPISADPADGRLLMLRLRALAPLWLRDALWLSNERLRSELYDAEDAPLPLHLTFRERAVQATESAAISAPQPNPTTGATVFTLQLMEAVPVQVTLSDLAGREVFRVDFFGAVGQNRAEIPASAFPQTGVYAWRVKAGSAVRAGRVVRL